MNTKFLSAGALLLVLGGAAHAQVNPPFCIETPPGGVNLTPVSIYQASINPSVQRVVPGGTAILFGDGSNAKTYSWQQGSGPPVQFQYYGFTSRISFAVPQAPPDGPWAITMKLCAGYLDGFSEATGLVWIDVPPVVVVTAPAAVAEGSGVTIDASGSHDPDEEVVAIKLTQLSGPTVTVTQNQGVIKFTAPQSGFGAALSFQLDVSDARFVTSKIIDIQVTSPSGATSSINTFAGGGGYLNSPPLSVSINPAGVAIGPDGAVYFTDQTPVAYTGSEVLRIDPITKEVTRVVGNGVIAYTGDDGPAINASLSGPLSLAFDGAGNLWIADSGNNAVRRVTADPRFDPGNPTALPGGPITANSVITTITRAIHRPNALVFDSTHTVLYISTGSTIDSIPYIAKIIVAFNITNGSSATIVGGCGVNPCVAAAEGIPGYSAYINPQALAIDSSNNLYIANGQSAGPLSILRLDGPNTTSQGTLHLITGVLPASVFSCSSAGVAGNLSLVLPAGMVFDRQGDLLVTDGYSQSICKISMDASGHVAQDSIVSSIGGGGSPPYPSYIGAPGNGDNGPATQARFSRPTGIAVDDIGDIYFSDSGYGRIRKIDTSGTISSVAGMGQTVYGGDGNPALSSTLESPVSVATDSQGNLYIAQVGVVRRVDHATNVISSVAGNQGAGLYAPGCTPLSPYSTGDGGQAICASITANAVAVDAKGNLYIAGYATVRRVDVNGVITTIAGNQTAGYSGDGGSATSASINRPQGIAVDQLGNVYISDTGNNRIRRVSQGIITTVVNMSGSAEPLCNGGANSPTGCAGDGGPAQYAMLNAPSGIAVDAAGNLYIADTGAIGIRHVAIDPVSKRVEPYSVISTVYWSVGTLYGGTFCTGLDSFECLFDPVSIGLDAGGNLYIGDGALRTALNYFGNAVVRLAAPSCNGAVCVARAEGYGDGFTRLTLHGTGGYSGDGGYAEFSELNNPNGVAVDPMGNIYVADTYNNRIRIITGVATAGIDTVPNVAGATQAAATIAITGAGLVVGTVTRQSSSTVAAGLVMSESPAAGTSVVAQSAVNLVVSSGQLVGDVNGDGVVNCADLAIVKASFGKKSGQSGFDPRADVNHDGIVNIVDLSMVARAVPTGTVCN
jgi:sugar lactone lactonase YvrE